MGKSEWRINLAGCARLGVLLMTVAFALNAGAEQRMIKSRVSPVYPDLARKMKIAGVVKIEATVDAEGKVIDVKTLNGSRVLASSAEDAVRKWKFASGDGVANVDLDVTFVLSQ